MADATLTQDLAGRITQIIRKVAKTPADVAIGPDSDLVDDLGVDSLDFVGVILQIQDEFGVEVDEVDVPRLRSVAEIAAYVSARRGVAAA